MNNDSKSFYDGVTNSIDVGLRKYMLNVFSYMSFGLFLTAVVSFFVGTSPSLKAIFFSSPIAMIFLFLVPLGIAIYLNVRIAKISVDTARMLFMLYATLIGVSLSAIFVIYSGASIATAFFVTSSMFLSMVIYGYSTGKDLTNVGSFLMMGLFGIIIASVINIFLRSSVMEFVISFLGVIIFTGLTAYDTQVIKSYYYESDSEEVSSKKAIIGAFRLYLDFINLFVYILRFIGVKKD